MRSIIIIGANGRVGAALTREYQRPFSVKAFARNQLDLGKLDQVRSTLSEIEFDLLINCAALTNVDYCESHRDEAFLVNSQGPRLLAEICSQKSAKLVHISTDYVFDGKQDTPYIEKDPPAPLSVYAESKLTGEEEVLAVSPKNLVVRLSWVFGPDKPSFIDQIIQRAREDETVAAWPTSFPRPPTRLTPRVGCAWPWITTAFCIYATAVDAVGRSGRSMRLTFATTLGFR